VVGEYGTAAARDQNLDGLVERRTEHIELAVHFDAQGLERALGRVTAAPAGRGGNGVADDIDQLGGGRQRAGGDDGVGDAAGEALVAVVVEHRREPFDWVAVDHVGRGKGLAAVHAHIEGGVLAVAEAPGGPVNLRRAHAQVEQDRDYRIVSRLVHHCLQPVESGSAQDDPVLEAHERDVCCNQGLLVPVQTQEAVSGKSIEQGPGVPAAAHGGVDDQAGGHGPEQFDDLVDHHRPVLEPLAHLQPPDRAGTVGMSPRSM